MRNFQYNKKELPPASSASSCISNISQMAAIDMSMLKIYIKMHSPSKLFQSSFFQKRNIRESHSLFGVVCHPKWKLSTVLQFLKSFVSWESSFLFLNFFKDYYYYYLFFFFSLFHVLLSQLWLQCDHRNKTFATCLTKVR